MLGWQGELVEKKDRCQVLLSEVTQDDTMAASTGVSSDEASAIDASLERRESATSEYVVQSYPPTKEVDTDAAHLLSVANEGRDTEADHLPSIAKEG